MKKNILFKFFGLLCICVLLCVLAIYSVFFIPNVSKKGALYIRAGSKYSEVIHQMNTMSILKSKTSFKIAVRLTGSYSSVCRGSYFLDSGMTNFQILKILKKGLQRPIKFTVSMAANKNDFVQQACRKLDLNEQKLLKMLNNDTFLKDFGFNSENILAMFIPNTYEMYWTISEKDFLEKMYREYLSFWTEIRLQKAKELCLSPIQVYILASIVQMETNNMIEASRIAGVYINRLRKKMPLCSCPTIKHIINNAGGGGDIIVKRILKDDLKRDSPYNTYKRPGLPPGPICMPSIACIDAVLDFEKHDYFYFSTKEDFSGSHYFAKNLKDHNKNAFKYRKKMTERKIFR